VDKIEHRTVTNFFVKDGLTPHEIHSKFIKVYRDSSHSFFRIKKWAAGFKHGRTSLEYDPLEGSPKCATTPEIIEQVHDVLLDERWMKVRKIAETMGISKERVGYILHKELDMKSFAQSGCRPCSQQIKNALAWKSLNNAWNVLTKIKPVLCVDLLLWMRLGFTITHQNLNSSQISGQKPVVQCQRRQVWFHQQESS